MSDIILVEPEIAENIGFIARSMKVFGCEKLVLINPPEGFFDGAYKTASGAHDILEGAVISDSFEKIAASYDILVGTTRRQGGLRYPIYSPQEIAKHINATSETKRIGIVFGRESTGLLNEELQLCTLIACIPTASASVSLNVSHAAAIFLYALFQKETAQGAVSDGVWDCPAQSELKALSELMFSVLKRTDFISYGEDSLKENLLHLLKKGMIEKKDVKLLTAIWYHFQKLAVQQNR